MSDLSGPGCLMANFSSNLNFSNGVFLTETTTLVITGATPLAISASDIVTTKDTGKIIGVKQQQF